MAQTSPNSGRSPTQWESFLITVIGMLVEKLPGLIRNGNPAAKIAPYTNIALPDLQRHDTKQQLALCALMFKPAATTLLSVRESRLNGLDTVSAYGAVTFPIQDVKLSVPLIFNRITLAGKWATDSQCQRGSEAPVLTVQSGTYTLGFNEVQVTLEVTLDQKATTATAVTVTLTDGNQKWASQPDFDPARDMTFDTKPLASQKVILGALLKTEDVRSQLRSSVQQAIQSPQLADGIRTTINSLLAEMF